MIDLLRMARIVAAKDLRMEWRTKTMLVASGVFGLLVLVVFNLGFPPDRRDPQALTPGILWVAFVFAGNLALSRAGSLERDDGGWRGLMVSPLDRGALYLGKLAGTAVVLLSLEALLLLVHVLFFSILWSPQQWCAIAMVALLGTVGFLAVGTLMTTVADGSGSREVLLPLLVLPLTSPVLIAAVRATAAIIDGGGMESIDFWLRFLFGYDGVFVVLGFVLFEYVAEE